MTKKKVLFSFDGFYIYNITYVHSTEIDSGLAVSLARDIAEAMHFLHGIPLVHRDLKSPNILV